MDFLLHTSPSDFQNVYCRLTYSYLSLYLPMHLLIREGVGTVWPVRRCPKWPYSNQVLLIWLLETRCFLIEQVRILQLYMSASTACSPLVLGAGVSKGFSYRAGGNEICYHEAPAHVSETNLTSIDFGTIWCSWSQQTYYDPQKISSGEEWKFFWLHSKSWSCVGITTVSAGGDWRPLRLRVLWKQAAFQWFSESLMHSTVQNGVHPRLKIFHWGSSEFCWGT